MGVSYNYRTTLSDRPFDPLVKGDVKIITTGRENGIATECFDYTEDGRWVPERESIMEFIDWKLMSASAKIEPDKEYYMRIVLLNVQEIEDVKGNAQADPIEE